MFKKKTGQRGFTLIELLVVIAIIGILSSVVLVSLQSSRAKARDAKRIADVGSIQQALALYYDSRTAYPDALGGASNSLVSENLLPSVPKGPNGEDYKYSVSADKLTYHLGSTLEQVAVNSGVLASDRNCNDGSPYTCTGFSASNVGSAPFDGANAAGTPCGGTTPATNEPTGTAVACYDVTP